MPSFVVPVGPRAQEPPPESVLERRLTPDQVADLLQVEVGTIYRHCRSGVLPHERVGKRIRIRPSDLDVYRGRLERVAGRARDEVDGLGPGRGRSPRGRFARIASDLPVEDAE